MYAHDEGAQLCHHISHAPQEFGADGVCACSAGLGQIDHEHLDKKPPQVGMLVVKIGGPAYRIGMGGGAASSVPSGSREGGNAADLDFNAVQVCLGSVEYRLSSGAEPGCYAADE